MATDSSIFAWEISWTEERNLAGYSPWGHKELDMTEQQTLSLSQAVIQIHTVIYLEQIYKW